MESKTSFGSWLKQRRKVLDLTQDDLARQAGCALSTIRKIEQDQRRPSRQVAQHLLMCLGVSPSEQEDLIRLARVQSFPSTFPPLNLLDVPSNSPKTVSTHSQPSASAIGPTQESIPAGFPETEHRQICQTNLPAPPTSFIGWAAEVERLHNLLQRPGVRLVTLMGPGGAGKTRLGLQVASQLVGKFEHGVYFVALAPIRDSDLVGTMIAQTLGIKEEDKLSLGESLKAYLKTRQMLLVLDNFEQVLGAAVLVADLLEAASELKILVTSRAALRLYGEHEFEVPPLALPDLRQLPPLSELAQLPAMALFVERAQTVQPDFELTEQNAVAVAELCTHLDGLPLAIELAAARVKLLSPQVIVTRLSDRLTLLTDGAKNLPKRQQAMRNTLDWSYDLLEPDEKTLFAHLGVFVGGCTLDAVEAVSGIPFGSSSIDQITGLMEQLASLVHKSMLLREMVGDETRFSMLEIIREYAHERLEVSDEAELLHQRHTAYYLEMAESTQPKLAGNQSQIWLNLLEQEHDNLRAALRWALRRETQSETALRLATVLGRFWNKRGYLGEGRRWLEAALEQSETQPAMERAKAFRESASLALGQGDYVQAKALLETGQALWGDLSDEPFVTWMMGLILDAQGKYQDAQIFLETNLFLHCKAGNWENVAHALHLLGQIAMKQGNYAQAQAWQEESLVIRQNLEVKEDIAISLLTLGHTRRLQGDYEQACKQYQKSLAMAEELGLKWVVAHSLLNLGNIACLQKEYAKAGNIYLETLRIFQELGDRHGLVYNLEAQANLAGLQGQPERAARLWGAAEVLRETLGTPLPPAEYSQFNANVTNIKNRWVESGQPDAEFLLAWEEGRKMLPEEAIGLAQHPEN
jgi:predicted ATPase/transcriptional regulator with XRE-family HTH domain